MSDMTRRDLVECYKRVFELEDKGENACHVTGDEGSADYQWWANMLCRVHAETSCWARIGARRQAVNENVRQEAER